MGAGVGATVGGPGTSGVETTAGTNDCGSELGGMGWACINEVQEIFDIGRGSPQVRIILIK